MRRALLALVLVLFAFVPAYAADAPTVTGVYLVAAYPSVTVSGDNATVDLKLRNYGEAPQALALSVTGLPDGWKAQFLGGGQPVAAAEAATNDSVDLQLRLDFPSSASAGASLVLHADGGNQHASLPLQVTLGNDLPVNLTIKPDLPSLRGTPSAAFTYNLAVRNDSGKDLIVSMSSTAPQGFQTSFTKQYDTQEISSLPIKAGATENVSMKVTPPQKVNAGTYTIVAQVNGGGASGKTPVTMEIEGTSHLFLSTPDGRLSGTAEAGAATQVTYQISNTGTAPATNISFSASTPADWKVDFAPSTIDSLAPNDKKNVVATITPTDKAIAGDYTVTMSASAGTDSSNSDYRVTVTTSAVWGIVGVAIIAIALLALLGAVARFGRR